MQSHLSFFHERQIEVFAHSFLQFEAIPFEQSKPYEVIFFGSPRAVFFFLEQEIIPEGVLIGCIGKITAESLVEKGYVPHFVGSVSGDPSEVAQNFKVFAGNRKVLFPQSTSSNRSVSSVFESNQRMEISIYTTKVYPKQIENCDHYVFTSPSNVEGFLLQNSIPNTAVIIAWGKTTEASLLENNIQVTHTLKSASLPELMTVLGH